VMRGAVQLREHFRTLEPRRIEAESFFTWYRGRSYHFNRRINGRFWRQVVACFLIFQLSAPRADVG
jgi:hypothetical protein